MKYRIEDNTTGRPLSRWFDSWGVAVGACATLNSAPGAGGYAGIYDETGARRQAPTPESAHVQPTTEENQPR